MWKLSVRALLRKKSEMSQARDYFHMHEVDKNQNTNKMEEFSTSIILNPILGMHRSLFHPLATVRHRI